MASKEITPAMVKELRDRTGIGLGKCKEALEEAHGDIDLAIDNLRKKGMATAIKKEGRETKEGIIKTKESSSAIALIEVNAETDFVVRNENFIKFAETLADELIKHPSISVEEFLKQKHGNQTIDEYRASIVQTLGENIQIKRIEIFAKKKDRSFGLYSHGAGKLVTLVEITGSDKEEELAKEIAMHVAAESPEYLSKDEVPERVIAHEKEIASAQMKGKPANIIDKIVEGKMKAYFEQVCLINQPFIKDSQVRVGELVERKGKSLGKELKITQFIRWQVGR